MTRKEGYVYDDSYTYLKSVTAETGGLKHDLRTAARDYIRVYFPLGLKPGDKLLDVGCCVGTLGHFLKYGGILTHGIDVNHAAIAEGRRLFGNEARNTSLVADGACIPFPQGEFDAIVSQDVFEHLNSESHAHRALSEMGRVLKQGKRRMFHKITVLEDKAHIHDDDSHFIKWPTDRWVQFFGDNGWNAVNSPTRKFPIASSISYGNFLLERSS